MFRKQTTNTSTVSSATATTLATLWFHPYGDRYATGLFPHRARPSRLTTSFPRLTSARIPTLLSNRGVAAPSCNALTTGVFRHDISISISLSFFLLFYLIPVPFTTTPWTRTKHCDCSRGQRCRPERIVCWSCTKPSTPPGIKSCCVLSPFSPPVPFVLKLCRQCT